jgi:hypothetical protein
MVFSSRKNKYFLQIFHLFAVRISFCCFFLLATSVLAQTGKQISFSHPLTVQSAPGFSSWSSPRSTRAVPETLRVLAAMIAFQPDNDDRTTGDGSFALSDTLGRVIDPPPHNRSYFDNHLTFLENYFRKVSHGKLILQCDILDSIYRMPYQIAHYSPPRSSTSNTELGYLMQDAWHIVDSVSPGRIAQKQYDAYILFHAGAGRDIDLTALYGYDPTPLDIPSVYLNLASLRKMFGSSYEGVSVNGGSIFITNSMVIPETESRLLSSIGGISLYELSINGLLCASVGSHLGLPDLFDTKTGLSGIGRFGLMDGESIFSWNGVYPPEPSAWEKIELGWVQPITMANGSAVYNFPAVSLANNPDSIYRVLISEKEYFLVENRNRDANRDGETVTMVIHDSTYTQTWNRDTIGFNAYNTNSLFGVITDVDEFDWSLPGGVNTSTGEFFDGGLLIWHIDENVIDSTIADDAVNANPDRKGVNLMEADGSQDIGQSYGFLSAGSGSESGTQLDFWYEGNEAPLRIQSNAFTPTSHPSSLSVDLANSHIYINDFSTRGPHMTARIQIGDDVVTPVQGFPVPVNHPVNGNSLKTADLNGDGFGEILLTTGPAKIHSGWVYAWRSSGQPIDTLFSPAGDLLRVAYALRDVAGDHLVDSTFGATHAGQILTTPVIFDSLLVAGIGDSIYFLGKSGFQTGSIVNSSTRGLSLLSRSGDIVSCSPDSNVTIFSQGGIEKSMHVTHPIAASAVAGNLSIATGLRIVFGTTDGLVYAVSGELKTAEGFPVSTNGEIHGAPALADIDGDGRTDIIVCSGNRIFAMNANGVMLDNFPVTTPSSLPLLASPIVADVNGDRLPDIITVTQEGLVVAYDRSGKMLPGFPLLSGINHGSSPVAFYMPDSCPSCIAIGLAATSEDGNVYAWRTGSVKPGTGGATVQPWPQIGRDAFNTGLFDTTYQQGQFLTFFPKDRAYNWPNPVDRNHGFKTHIRYFVSTSATVHIKIFDMAGDLVTELTGPGNGGFDNEVEWDVSKIQSGIYFAHIDAQGSGGSGSAVIKIAVVK